MQPRAWEIQERDRTTLTDCEGTAKCGERIGAVVTPLYAIPSGWRLVPEVPTEEMAGKANDEAAPYMVDARDLWRVMLGAAPSPTDNTEAKRPSGRQETT